MKEITFGDILIYDLQTLEKDRERLTEITDPLEYKWKSMRIADRERLLDQLDSQERFVIDHIIINKKKPSALSEATGLTVKEIQYKLNDTIEKLLTLRHGAAYHP